MSVEIATGSKSVRVFDIPSILPSVSCKYLMDGLPPCSDPERLRFVLRMVPESEREDAIQEAWLAHLEGCCPARAIDRWNIKQFRRRQIERTNHHFK